MGLIARIYFRNGDHDAIREALDYFAGKTGWNTNLHVGKYYLDVEQSSTEISPSQSGSLDSLSCVLKDRAVFTILNNAESGYCTHWNGNKTDDDKTFPLSGVITLDDAEVEFPNEYLEILRNGYTTVRKDVEEDYKKWS